MDRVLIAALTIAVMFYVFYPTVKRIGSGESINIEDSGVYLLKCAMEGTNIIPYAWRRIENNGTKMHVTCEDGEITIVIEP